MPGWGPRRLALLWVLTGMAGSGLAPAVAATGILALDETAIAVKAPGRVYLDAIARAGTRLVAVGEHGVISYSDDNGASWRQASVPVDATLTAIAFATPREGWAAGNSGVILHTGDGGESWQLQLDGVQANRLTLAAAQAVAGQVVAARVAGAPAGEPPNGAALGWGNAMRRANIFMAQGPDRPFLSILVLGPKSAIVFGAYRMTMRTDDGGKSWTDWSLHIGDAVSHNLYGAAHVGGGDYVVGETGLVFRSGDGGANFPAVSSPAGVTLFGVTGTGDGVLVYGVAGMAFKSFDNGQSWRPVAVATAANLLAAITLQSGEMLLASQAGMLFLSHDHAATFQPVPGGLPMAVFDIAQAADGGVVAVGNLGAVKLPASDFLHH